MLEEGGEYFFGREMTVDRTRNVHICLVWGGGGRHQAARKACTVVWGKQHRAVQKRMVLLAGEQHRAGQIYAKFVAGKYQRARQIKVELVGGKQHKAGVRWNRDFCGKMTQDGSDSVHVCGVIKGTGICKKFAKLIGGKRQRDGEKGSNVVGEKMALDKVKAIFLLRKWRRRTFKEIC
ncbi:hypothetical protein T10_1883 [Trichinella papuae]|uniref:Uncharacterized protein n=1 Tax=Trichinella papuae TaxID=268474 RepID=A0A0V1M4B2_9BILA|nr:hypothetical protein T10_1883 [Trichinella papuae]